MKISTSILTVEEDKSIKTFYELEVARTDYYHIDVMDGKFVEKNTEKQMYKYSNELKQITSLPLDVHFMVENIEENIEKYIPLEPQIITFHYEACKDKEEVKKYIDYIKENNIKCGISIKPNTPVEEIYEFLPYVYLCLVMTVEPGKGGQKLIPETLEKVEKIREYRDENNLNFFIEVDGGINKTTIADAKKAGADIFVVGSAIISSDNYKEEIANLKK